MGEIKRFKRANQFRQIYEILCSQKCVSPLAPIQAHLTENRLKFCCDRVNLEDWSPILNSLAADRSLVCIDVYSRHRPKRVVETVDTEEKLEEYRQCRRTVSRAPMIYTNFLLRCFVDAVAVCSRNSSILTSLSLDGIPLADSKYLDILCAGLVNNRSLENVSLVRCRIGDKGCDSLLHAILDNSNLRLIDFTTCLLTSKSGDSIASFLKKKRAKLLENVWNESAATCLEGTEAKQSSHGLQILVLDKNRKFGDDGLRVLTRALKDDFWLKKLSLRNCGLTKISGDLITDLLETNSVLVGMHLKNNDVPVEIVRAVRKLLKRRQENGERIPLKRRLINRKKILLNRKSETSSKEKRARNRRRIKLRVNFEGRRRMKIRILKSRESEASGRSCRPNLKQLKERLSKAIDGNRNLMRSLANEKQSLVREKRSRLNAEHSYQLLRPVFEKLRYGVKKQNGLRRRVLLESHLCVDLRTIFRGLEKISANNASGELLNGSSVRSSKVMNVKKDLSPVVERKRMMTNAAQKRPYCPPRQKV